MPQVVCWVPVALGAAWQPPTSELLQQRGEPMQVDAAQLTQARAHLQAYLEAPP